MRFSKEEKAKRLADWQVSGKSAWKYAKENGLSPQTFLKWTKMEIKPKSDFMEVPVKIISLQKAVQEIVIEKEGIKINLPVTIGCNELRTIFTALKDTV